MGLKQKLVNSTPAQNLDRFLPFYKTTMRLKCFLFFISIIANNFSYAQTKEGLKDTIKNLLVEQKLSGAVWATVSEKGEIVTDAYGYKNTKTKEILRPTDKVHVGSIAKTILATSFLRMASIGLLNFFLCWYQRSLTGSCCTFSHLWYC